MFKIVLLLTGFFFFARTASAQVDKLPAPIRETFTGQYPHADSIQYIDNFLYGTVNFVDDGYHTTANYTKKGVWKSSEKTWSFDQVPNTVKDGLSKSKYADWKVEETKIVYRPGGVERYRIKVGKNDVQKKYLYFNKDGRLVEDAITL